MIRLTLRPRLAKRLATVCTVWAWISLSVLLAVVVWGQEAKAPDTQLQAEKPPVEKKKVLLTDPPLDGHFDLLPYEDALKRESGTITKILSEGDITRNQEALFDSYFIKFSIGRWTQPNNLASLPAFRKELHSRLQTTFTKGSKVYAHLNALLVTQMEQIALGNYAPVVRINAAFMLGELNGQELTRPNEVAVPLASALEPLIRVLNRGNQLESVQVAALEGLRRHAEAGIPAGDTRTVLQRSLLAMVLADTPPDRYSTGYDWMRGQAANILGAIGDPSISAPGGKNGEIALALGQLVGNTKMSQGTRLAAARALGRLDYTKASGLNITPLAIALIHLTIDACQSAKKALDDQGALPPVAKPTPNTNNPTALSASLSANNQSILDINRQLRSFVQAVKTGFTGDGRHNGVVGAAKDDAQKKLTASASEQVTKLAAALDLPKADVDKEKIVAAITAALAGLTPLVEPSK